MALPVARWTLLACIAIWATALGAALLGGPIGLSFMVAQCALLGMIIAAFACLALQVARLVVARRSGSAG